MSICRWSKDCQVYLFDDVGGGVTCCSCRHHMTPAEAANHVIWHDSQGDMVPPLVLSMARRHRVLHDGTRWNWGVPW